MSFSANWPMRGEPAPLMFPKPELFTLAVGLFVFKRQEPRFADNI